MNDSRGAALRPLHAVWDAIALLREGQGDSGAEREAVLRVSEAIESSLRRLLRNDSSQPLEVRLKALEPDEMGVDEVISSLRQRDLVSIELAAAFHDLLEVRRRLLHGAAPSARDIELVLQVAGRVEREATATPAASFHASPAASRAAEPAYPDDATLEAGDEPLPPSLVRSRRGLPWYWGVVAAGVLLVFALGLWWMTARSGSGLDQAIALFRTGDFEAAAVQFEQHAQARPNDPTPRLYLARIHRRTGRFEEAREQLRLALAVAPEDAALHRELGFLLLDVGRPVDAVARFRSAVERDADSIEGWVGLVRALRESGQAAAAERVLNTAPSEVRALLRQSAPPPSN